MKSLRSLASGCVVLVFALISCAIALSVLARPCPIDPPPLQPPLEPGNIMTEQQIRERYEPWEAYNAACENLWKDISVAELLRKDISRYFGFVAPAWLVAIGWLAKHQSRRSVLLMGTPTFAFTIFLGPDLHGLALLAVALGILLMFRRNRRSKLLSNISIDTDPHLQKATSPQRVVVRSTSS